MNAVEDADDSSLSKFKVGVEIIALIHVILVVANINL